MGQARNWTQEELNYLMDNWGVIPKTTMAKKLNRSINAINIKKDRLGLGAFLDSGEYVSFNQLLIALGKAGGYGYKSISWIRDRGFPVKYKTVENSKFRVVYLKDFWQWAEAHRNFIDFSTFERHSLGEEPAWVEEQRNRDKLKNLKYKTAPWTKIEDQRLAGLLKEHRYTYLELSIKLGRTSGAIQKRILDLSLRERPVKADNHVSWENEDFERLSDFIKQGYSYDLIAEILQRSSKAIRGLVYRVYRTERIDLVRTMMGDGQWGDGKPEPIVGGMLLPAEKRQVRQAMADLTTLLKVRRNQLAFDGYWQKDMCIYWDNVKGCTAGESDCDSCSSFIRIREQYCRRCGATFMEREQMEICPRCKVQRKKQYQKKWAVLNKKQ